MTTSGQDKPPPAVPTPPSDRRLWDALRRCEPEALGELFTLYAGLVHAYAVRHTGSYATADDAVQATFITAWRQFDNADPGPLTRDTARAWLLAITRNELRNTTRARRRLAHFVSRHGSSRRWAAGLCPDGARTARRSPRGSAAHSKRPPGAAAPRTT
jgi:RNA polymerase sigma factor (sigma-70 family)